MGRRGPAPTPTKIKILRGETRPSRVNYRERLVPGVLVGFLTLDPFRRRVEAEVDEGLAVSNLGAPARLGGSRSRSVSVGSPEP